MTRFVVDRGAVLRSQSEGVEMRTGHELLAPKLLRSRCERPERRKRIAGGWLARCA